MEKEFKILQVSIEWSSPNKVRKITKSFRKLKPSNSKEDHFYYDFVLYPKQDKKYLQFCIQTSSTPILKSNDGKWLISNQLYNIQDDLWIIKGEWSNFSYQGKGYHKCPTINTHGELELCLSPDKKNISNYITIDVNSNIDGFNFDALKDDFEGELWGLLTSDKSKLKVSKSELKFGDKTFKLPKSQLVISFLKEFKIISKNPKKELKYTVELLPIERVKPIPKTYQQIVKTGLAKNLPSKAFAEHYDIYENRFTCFMLHKISKIAVA